MSRGLDVGILEHMFDKFSQALALMREAFADAQAGSGALADLDLAAQVDGAQQAADSAAGNEATHIVKPGTVEG